MSKYQYDLSRAIENSLRKAIQSAIYSKEDECYLITVDNENIIAKLNRLIVSIDGTLPPLNKRKNTVSTYKLQKSSRKKLIDNLGLEIEDEDNG